jgi:uncharacterized protein (TIGR00255 family)
MTGYGDATFSSDSLQVAVELRAVNNRYLKISLRATEPYHLLEGEIEKVLRRTIKRGTIQINLHLRRQENAGDYRLNTTALRAYLGQLNPVFAEVSPGIRSTLASGVLALPGVVPLPDVASLNIEEDWPTLEGVIEEGVRKLQAMREEEGRAMAAELLQLRDQIAAELEQIRLRSPEVASNYRERLLERVRTVFGELDVQLDRMDLIKEVAIFAERADISEEVVRLGSHLSQFQEIINEPESAGRKLEFLTQEMSRETNTIGSKAGDVEISRRVVEIKSALEKVRELVQNIE